MFQLKGRKEESVEARLGKLAFRYITGVLRDTVETRFATGVSGTRLDHDFHVRISI